MSSQFEITKRSRRPNYSMLNTPNLGLAAGTVQNARGVAFQESITADTAELANGVAPILGFVTRIIMAGGPQLGDSIYPGRIELPTLAGQEASFEYAEEIEAEGTDYICGTGVRTIDNTTAPRTPLSFDLGRFCKAQAGQLAEFELTTQLTPRDSTNVCRIRARRLTGNVQ